MFNFKGSENKTYLSVRNLVIGWKIWSYTAAPDVPVSSRQTTIFQEWSDKKSFPVITTEHLLIYQHNSWTGSSTPRHSNAVDGYHILYNLFDCPGCQSSSHKDLSDSNFKSCCDIEWQLHFWKEGDLFQFWKEARPLIKQYLNYQLCCLLKKKADKSWDLVTSSYPTAKCLYIYFQR